MKHFPKQISQLPKFDGAFDAFKLEANNCDVLFASYPAGTSIPENAVRAARFEVETSEIEFWFHALPGE